MPARLVVVGDGPRGEALRRRARGLPVSFLGFVSSRAEVARVLASADLCLAPGPHETFGLAALESLACGTPVVASRSSALAEIIQPDCGRIAADTGAAFGAEARSLLAAEPVRARLAARRRAEQFRKRETDRPPPGVLGYLCGAEHGRHQRPDGAARTGVDRRL